MTAQIKNRYRSFSGASMSMRWVVRFFFAFFMVFLVTIIQKRLYPNSELAHAVQMQYELDKITKETLILSAKIEKLKRENTHWQDPSYAVLQARKKGLVRRFPEAKPSTAVTRHSMRPPLSHHEEVYEFIE